MQRRWKSAGRQGLAIQEVSLLHGMASPCFPQYIFSASFGGLGVRSSDADSDWFAADPDTKLWLQQHVDPVFGFPSLVRFSWSTASKILETSAVQVQW